MFGVLVNVVSIIVGALIGVFVGKKFPESVSQGVLKVMGLFSMVVGIKGALDGKETMIVLSALVIGTVIGEYINIHGYIENAGEYLRKTFAKKSGASNERFVEAFASSSALFGIGAMAILGSIDAGLRHNYDIFYLKSMMDFVSAIMFATSMGIGVAFSSITILVLQGGMTLLAGLIKPIADNAGMMTEIICCGNFMIIAVGLNLLGITKLRIANMLPAIIVVPILYQIFK